MIQSDGTGADASLHAFSTLGCPEMSLDEVLALAARYRLGGVELRALSLSVDLPAVLAAAYGTPERLAARMAGSTVRIVGFGTSVRLLNRGADDRTALLAYVPWAEAAGVASLRLFDGGETADAAECALARETLRWWADTRAAQGWTVDLIVETHDATAHPDALARFLDAVPDAALLWDAHHTWKKGGEDPAVTWQRVAGRTRHIHVKDSVSAPGPKLPYTYVQPGFGEFPMPALRAALAANGYDGVLSLEWERMWHPDLPPLETALAAAVANAWW